MTNKIINDARIGERNKKIILSAAEKEFAKNGFKATSVQRIADRANLPKTNVLYYFKSKQELYLALLQQIMTLWNSKFDSATENDDPAETLADYIAEKMEMSRTNPEASKIFALEILNGANNLRSYIGDEQKLWFDGRLALINRWIEKKWLAPIDGEFLLYNIWACTQHYADFSSQITSLRQNRMKKVDFDLATVSTISLILKGCGLSVPDKYRQNDNE